jgi:hypothetical protein
MIGIGDQPKSGWLGRWWGKKEGEGGGPIRAKLGEESSMVFDKDLKRWVVKGVCQTVISVECGQLKLTRSVQAKPDAAPVAAPPPPPSRAQTASPSRSAGPEPPSGRATSATPPPPQQVRSGMSMSPVAPPSRPPTTGPPDGIKRMKSTLSESVVADDPSAPTPPPVSAKPPAGPPSRPGTSLDDLLSRPPAGKRVASGVAKKPMRNRYVDVFQPGAEGS